MDYIDLGIRIKKTNELKRHLSQEKLAEMLVISTSYMGQIERGEKRLSLENLVNIANVLNCSIDELLRKSTEDNINARFAEIYRIIENAPADKIEKSIEILKILCN